MATADRGFICQLAFGLAAVASAGWCGVATAGPDCRGLASAALASTTLTTAETPSPAPACRVKGVIRPVKGSRIGFELWLPRAGWNGRLLMLGNGGYSSALPLAAMTKELAAGYAVVATDTGHAGDDPSFARGRPEAIVDWGERAVHLTALRAKTLVARYYRQPARRAYFQGCSTGGHQAFMEVQRHPGDFDGVVAGAPGHNRTHLNAAFLWQYVQNHAPGDDPHPIIPATKLPLITRAVLATCRAQNGAAAGGLASDPYLNDPLSCDFDPGVLQCRADEGPDCLTTRQVTALRRMYAGASNPRTGERIAFGWPFGSESSASGRGGWSSYWADPANPSAPARAGFWRDWVFHDPAWSWWRFDFDRDMRRADDRLAPVINAMSAELEPFRRRGGKLIHYHGGADPVSPLQDSISYRARVVAAVARRDGLSSPAADAATDGFYRFFLAPGMEHCGGGLGPAPTDLQAAIEAWVERGQAPDRLIAARPRSGADGGGFTRPLCPYPRIARYAGGARELASSFVCAAPDRTPIIPHPASPYLR
jgi:feruloyl esterase